MTSKNFKLEKLGLEVELGKYARQANGSAWLKHGDNIVLATAVASKEARDFMGFFPLTVEYRERVAAAGKIPGGYLKREGRLSDNEILSSRLIDRPIRPMFPEDYFNEVQVLASVLSADGKYPPNILAFIASSLALTISDIPFLEPAGAVNVGRKDGKIVFNLGHEDLSNSDINIIVAGTQSGITMVEGHCALLTEQELIDIIFEAHEVIKEQVAWQLEIQKEVGKEKVNPITKFDWADWKKKIRAALPNDFLTAYFDKTKEERSKSSQKIKDGLVETFKAELESGELAKSHLGYIYGNILKEEMPDEIISRDQRIDGRDFNTVRPLEMTTGLLPQTHGSAIFQRGETQALVTATLGTGQDAQKVDGLIGGMKEKTFMLHYNFPPYCTGEVKMMRGVSRREVGHGYLAEKSFDHVLPSQEDFPYTIRIISDVLESNGSSSMATVCGSSLALMDAGVPIKQMIGGVAMGLIKNSSGEYHTLTDILGTEDALGLMDFKITGTEESISAVQMDIKEKKGLSKEVISIALAKAKDARLHILTEMKKVLSAPRSEVSEHAPRITVIKVKQEKIGALIGPGGKTIKEIISQTGVEIDIEDDGTVKIFSKDSESAESAKSMIDGLVGDVEIGTKYEGTVRKVFDYGLLVEILPGKSGLVHISAMSRDMKDQFSKKYGENSVISVEVADVDRRTGRIKLVAPDLQ